MVRVLWREILGSQLNKGRLGVGGGGPGGGQLSEGSEARQRREWAEQREG